MEKLWQELKRRNVVRVAVAYAVVAWLLLQLIDVVLPTFEAPAWVAKSLMFAIFVGFPVALVLAWAFELTPEGIKATTAVRPDESITPQTGQKLNRIIISSLALALVMVVLDAYVLPQAGVPTSAAVQAGGSAAAVQAAVAGDNSIAVLPFVNLSTNADQEYFSDGLSEEILNKLAQVPDLQVAARTSSFSFKNRNEDMRVIADTLGVNYLLEGSVRKSGDELRITAQLIQALSGFHVWSQTFDRPMADIFAVQDEIALAVSTALQITLGTGTFALPGNTRNVEAYQHFLRGTAYLNGGGNRDDVLYMQSAVDELVQAVTLAPDFGRAWLRLYGAYAAQIANAPRNRIPELTSKRQDAYDTAQALAPDMPELQLVAVAQVGDLLEQERALLELLSDKNSTEAAATARYANFLAYVGRNRAALSYAEQAVRLNPTNVGGYYLQGNLLLTQDRVDEARRVFARGSEVQAGGQGGFLPVLGWKIAYAERGRQGWGEAVLAQTDAASTNPTEQWNMRYARWLTTADPQAALQEMRSYAADPSIPQINQASLASLASLLGDLNLAEEYLNRFGMLDPWDPRFSELRKRLGFKTWVRASGLFDYWRASGNWADTCQPLPNTEDDFECL